MDIKRLRRHTRDNTIKLLNSRQFYEEILATPEKTRGVLIINQQGTVRLRGKIVVHLTRQRNPRMSTVFTAITNGKMIKIHLNQQKAALPTTFQRNTKYPCVFLLTFGKSKPPALIARTATDITIHLSVSSLKIEHEPSKTARLIATASSSNF